MRPLAALAVTATLLAAVAPAFADEPWFDADDVRRNGAVSSRHWMPEPGIVRIGSTTFAPGLAVGLRKGIRRHMGRRAALTLNLQLHDRAWLTLMPAGERGPMLLLQLTP